MRFRSLLRPYHGLAWHCSTARRGPLSPLIGDLYIEELATTFNISTVFTPDSQLSSYRGDHHFSHFIIVLISLHSPRESKPKKWLFSLLWMQKWLQLRAVVLGPGTWVERGAEVNAGVDTRGPIFAQLLWMFLLWANTVAKEMFSVCLFFRWGISHATHELSKGWKLSWRHVLPPN